jgi:hypothetical protein
MPEATVFSKESKIAARSAFRSWEKLPGFLPAGPKRHQDPTASKADCSIPISQILIAQEGFPGIPEIAPQIQAMATRASAETPTPALSIGFGHAMIVFDHDGITFKSGRGN